MENRDRDKMSQDESSSTGKKSDSESSFGKNIGGSESWDSEPSKDESSSGSSGWQGDSGRSSGGSRSNLGEQSDVSSDRSGGSSSDIEH